MAKDLKMTIGAINIKIHPHSPEKYIELFEELVNMKRRVPIRGDIYGSLSTFNFLDVNDKVKGFKGYIFKYLNINPNEPWFDVEQQKVVEPMQQVEVLKTLKPHFSFFMFYFIPKKHRVFFTTYYDSKSISPNSIAKFFTNLFYHPDIISKFGEVDVIVEPSIDGLERIFAINTLEKLELVVTKPNPDDHEEEEQKLLRRLGNIKAKRLKQEYVSESRESIQPDNDLRVLSKIAASNGYVYASGKDLAGKHVEESTQLHPFQENLWYSRDENAHDIFVRGADRMLSDIIRQ
ncbi:MAG: hypothetical protein A2076_07180 [Geobacteraceae bacterium GWC2_53_11]|nr:MAG: hypothetical protein A2076_07180 [Geobacteraceae bacterium GWC2_53_11]